MFYKLIPEEFIDFEKEFSTDQEFFAKHLNPISKEEVNLFDLVLHIESQIDQGLDLPICINNNFHLSPYSLEKYFEENCPEIIAITDLTGNSNHDNHYLHRETVKEIIQVIAQNSQSIFSNGTHFWEYLFEIERNKNYAHLPPRLTSYFVFESEQDCERYKTTHNKIGNEIVKIEPVEIKQIFSADMNFMDSIENHYTYSQAKEVINQYWNQEKSESPIMETFFTGTFRMKKD